MPTVSGIYQHQEDGIANGITERWRRTGNTLEITFQAHYSLKATMKFDDDNQIKRFDYHISDDLNGHYVIEKGKLHVRRTLPANTLLDDTLVWSDATVLDLPFLSCKGHTILHLKKCGLSPTFAPLLRSGDRAGDLAKKSVRMFDTDTIRIDDMQYETTHYRYMRDYWLDNNGIVVKVQADNYQIILVEYNH